MRCLRCLPSHIELVIARRFGAVDAVENGRHSDIFNGEEEEDKDSAASKTLLHVAASEIGSVATGVDDLESPGFSAFSPVGLPDQPADSRVSEWIKSSHMDVRGSAFDSSFSRVTSNYSTNFLSSPIQSSELQPNVGVGGLRPSWSSVPLVVMLRREKADFGISIAVYDDVSCLFSPDSRLHLKSQGDRERRSNTMRRRASSLNRRQRTLTEGSEERGRFATISRTTSLPTSELGNSRRGGGLLIVNSIKPGSCVDQDGRISVGDRLLFVNDRKLARASLGEAANALRYAPLGYTMIGVAKMTLVPVAPPPLTVASSPQFTALVSTPDDSSALQVKFFFSHFHQRGFYFFF